MKPASPVNIPIAIASLATSILLFMIAMPGWMVKPQRSLRVKLSIEKDTLPAGFYVDSGPDFVTVQVNADQAEYRAFADTAKATANLTDAKPGTHVYSVSLEPRTLRDAVVSTNLQAKFTLEQAKPRPNVPVFVVSSGKLSNPTLVVDRLVSDTARVTIAGRAKATAQVDHVRATYRLDTAEGASGQAQTVYPVPVDSHDQVVPDVDLTPQAVLVTARLSLAPQTKPAFVDVQFAKSQLPAGYAVKSYSIEPTSVTVTGSSMALSRISRVSTENVDLSTTTQTQTFPVKLKPIENVKIEPSVVQVTVYVEQLNMRPLNGDSSSPSSPTSSKTSKPSHRK